MTPLDHVVRLWERATEAVIGHWSRCGRLRRFAAGQWRLARRRPLAWMTLYAFGVAAFSYVALDRPLAWWFKAHVTGEFEGFWKTVTTLGLAAVWLVPSGVLWVMVMLAWRAAPTLEIRARLGRIAWVPGFFVLAMAASGLLNTLVKILVGRTRPLALFTDGTYGFAPFTHAYITNSLPSGHSQAAFAAMTALTLILPRYDIAFIAIAVLVAASRVLTSVHFLSDAVLGAWLGTFVTLAVHRLLTRRGIDVRLRFERDKRLAG